MIREELQRLLSPSFPENVFTIFSPQVDLSSSGNYLSLAIWYNFSNSPFSVGLKGQYFDFKISFLASAEQSVEILGQELLRVETSGEGDLRLSSINGSILGRWAFVLKPKIRVSVFGGLNFFPYKGKVFIDGQILIQSALGDILYQQSDNPTLDDVRGWNDRVPSLLVSPELGLSLGYRFAKNLGAFVDVSISQGLYLSLGLFFTQ